MSSVSTSVKPVGALSRKDAAAFLGVTTRSLDNYVRAGELCKCKLGSKTVFRVADLEAYLQSKLVPVAVSSNQANRS